MICFPRFDSDPFIAYMLDEKNGGIFRISPIAQFSSFHTMNFNYSENDGKIMFDSKTGKGKLVLEILGEYKKY